MKKRIISFILAIMMVIGVFPVGIFDAVKVEAVTVVDSGTCGDNLTWTIDSDGLLTISGTGAMSDYSYGVTAPWSEQKDDIKYVGIMDGVTSIGDHAFYECDKMTSITIPESVTSIGVYALYNCQGLTSIDLPDSLETIEDNAFYGCTNLTAITIPAALETISSGIFSYCFDLTSITIPESITNIGSGAFFLCRALKEVHFLGDAPTINGSIFTEVTATATYPAGNSTWTADKLQNYGGTITWMEAPEESVKGDVDGDGIVTVKDTIQILRYANNKLSVLDSGKADINGDGKINALDATQIGRFINRLTSVLGSAGDYISYPSGEGTAIDFVLEMPENVSVGDTFTVKGKLATTVDVAGIQFELSYDESILECTAGTISSFADAMAPNYSSDTGKVYITGYSATGINVQADDCFVLTFLVKDTDATLTMLDIDGLVTAVNNDTGQTSDLNVNFKSETVQIAESASISGTCGDNLTWTLDDEGTFTISGSGNMNSWADEKSVPWHQYRVDITKVIIEDGVESVGAYAFTNCTRLKDMYVGSDVGSVAYPCFWGTAIDNVYAADFAKIVQIEYGSGTEGDMDPLFRAASNLYINEELITEAVIPEGVERIGDYALFGLDQLTSISLPSTLKSIGNDAFFGCWSVTEVRIADITKWCAVTLEKLEGVSDCKANPASVCNNIYIGDSTEVVTEITVPGSVKKVGDFAFYGWENLKKVTIEDGVEEIGAYAFAESGLVYEFDQLIIPDSVKILGEYAFSGTDLDELVLGNGLTHIPEGAFYYSSLSSVEFGENIRSIGKESFSSNGSLYDIVLPCGLESIGESAFSGSGIMRLTIPDTVKTIGVKAFDGCQIYEPLTIPSSVTEIGEFAFNQASIGDYGYLGYGQIAFAGNAPEINSTAFTGVTAIATYPAGNATWTADKLQNYGGTITWKEAKVEQEYVASGTCGENLTWTLDVNGELTISGTGDMFDYTFNNTPWSKYKADIKSVDIGKDVTRIGNYAFENSTAMTSVSIPEGVTSIGNFAFIHCTSVTEIDIPDSVSVIGNAAFEWCSALTDMTIPNGVTIIGNDLFSLCDNLVSVALPDSVTSIGSNAFSSCYSLTNVNIPENVTYIGDSAFSNCKALTGVIVPDGVTGISNSVFCAKSRSAVMSAISPP